MSAHNTDSAREIMGLFQLMFGVIALIGVSVIQDRFLQLTAVVCAPFFGVLVTSSYIKWRGYSFAVKKKASPLELHDTPLFADQRWFDMLFWQTLQWIVWSVAIALAVTFAQSTMSSGTLFGWFIL